ncbi:MAG: T9SS type B sorting domain-containing protein [Bacteroidetes bacterium]|nr:T9SS type B sorting domain-containing protein [Bacteroidota bacterium]
MKIRCLFSLFFSVTNFILLSQTVNNNGGFITAQPGSFIYVNGSVSNNNTGILAVNGNGTPTSSELYVTQDVINNSNINADGYIRLLGNWIDNSIFNSTLGTVFFEGANQFLGGTSVTQFFNLTLDGTGIKTQQVDKITKGTLDLKHLHLNTDIYGSFVTNAALNSVLRTTGFVSSANGGFLARTTSNTGMYLFPTGSNANTSANIPGSGTFRYRPVELNPNDANLNVYSVRMANLDASVETYNRNSAEPILCESNPAFYHQIDRISGSSAADVGVCFIPATDGQWNDMARWNITTNGIWQDIPTVNLTPITGFTKSVATSWNNFGDIPYILTNLNPATPTINTTAITGCSPLTASLQTTGISGVNYSWSANGNSIGTGTSISEIFNTPGCYNITLTASVGNCSASSTASNLICVDNSPTAAFTSSLLEFTGSTENVTFSNNSSGADSYLWDFGNNTTSTLTNPSVLYSGINGSVLVTLYAYTDNGCVDSTTTVISYQEDAIFYVPNSFTPDQDEYNQTWGPVFTQGFDPFNFDLYVFNRWGEVIWESHDASKRWDGTYGSKGTKCPDGVYTWKIGYKPKETDEKVVVTGHINLIR